MLLLDVEGFGSSFGDALPLVFGMTGLSSLELTGLFLRGASSSSVEGEVVGLRFTPR